METFEVLGALAATEGVNSMAILTPPQPPSGKVTWTSRDIATADQTFAGGQAGVLNTLLLTSACVVAWKEAAFEQKANKNDDGETSAETASQQKLPQDERLSQEVETTEF